MFLLRPARFHREAYMQRDETIESNMSRQSASTNNENNNNNKPAFMKVHPRMAVVLIFCILLLIYGLSFKFAKPRCQQDKTLIANGICNDITNTKA